MAVLTRRPGTPSPLHPAEKVARYRELGWWTDETIDGLLRAALGRHPDTVAVIDPPDKTDLTGLPAHRLTWSELDSAVDHLAAALLRRGIRVGEVVGVQLPNIVELVISYLAIVRIGAIISPLAAQYRQHELATTARLASFDAFLTASRIGGRSTAANAAEALADVDSVRSVFAFHADPADLPDDVIPVEFGPATPEDRELVRSHLDGYHADPNHCVTICWTSGTEGEPKGVPRCHYDWLAIATVSLDAPNLGEDDVILNPFPLVNMASVGGTLLPWLKLGARYVLHHPFTLPTFLRQIAEERVTYTVAPPALLTMLLRQEELLRHSDLSSLRSIGSGSAPLPASMVAGWQDRLGINVLNMFGSNEGVCLLSTAIDFPDPEQRAAYFPRYGAPGVNWSCRAMDQVAIRLVDTTTGEEITRPGQRGEMRIAGPTIFAGYLDGTGDDPFDERGFLRSGDVFELAGDHGQYLKFVDRAGDLINRGGMKIAPAEVEDLLLEHPAVAEAALVGYPDEVLGEKSCAVIVTRPGSQTTPDELLAHLRARHIASYKLPERFEFVESLPHNAIGKVLRRELRDRL
ncbi:MAG TPA: class I adenylate-forming enzyme family protein [Pseudonocardiaceae bacterium]